MARMNFAINESSHMCYAPQENERWSPRMVLRPDAPRQWMFPFFASSMGVAAFASVWLAIPWMHLVLRAVSFP
jgi:hypothetical protein